jgi:hypothetical protein
MVRVMATVGVEQNLKRHSEIIRGLPWIRPLLHQPSRRTVSQRVRGSGPLVGIGATCFAVDVTDGAPSRGD